MAMLAQLDQAIKLVCPIDGVSGDRHKLRIDFGKNATADQILAAKAVLAAWDWDAPETIVIDQETLLSQLTADVRLLQAAVALLQSQV